MSDALAAPARDVPGPGPWLRRCAAAAVLVVAADWLFYGHAVGVSAALFPALLWLCALAANATRLTGVRVLAGAAILFPALLPLAAQSTTLGWLFALAGVALATRATLGGDRDGRGCAYNALWLFADMGWRAARDVVRAAGLGLRLSGTRRRLHGLAIWIVPFALGGIFIALFAAANPLIDLWLRALDPSDLLARLSFSRMSFWLLAAFAVWPFVFVRRRRAAPDPATLLGVAPPAWPEGGRLFGREAILRALVLFNLLFAVQTGLDALYLWGGVALPDGMTYAGYAHRGAYPLIVTALLAAGFVIVATRPGSAAAASPLIRRLVYLWVAQNVMLVVSSLLRLDLYVAAYSLTYLRVAAFVWMVLVAVGLVLILVRLALDRSTGWLVAANALSLTLALYACSLVNLPRLIATYNVGHSRLLAGDGAPLDVNYLFALGPQAIPAIDRYIAASGPYLGRTGLLRARDDLARAHAERMRDWRAWTFEDGRLAGYLAGQPPEADDGRAPWQTVPP